VDTGYPTNPVQAVAVDPADSRTLYTGVVRSAFRGTLLKSEDAGDSWSDHDTGLSGGYTGATAVHPLDPLTACAAATFRIYRTDDGGRTWSFLATLPSPPVALQFHPVHPDTLYAATGSAGFYRSDDGGKTWLERNEGLTNPSLSSLAIDPSSPITIYVSTYGGGVFKTTDGGESWGAVNTGLTILYVPSVAIDPEETSVLYATTSEGIFKTSNGGGRWELLAGSPRYGAKVVVAPGQPSTVYSAAACVFRSQDGGATWQRASEGLPGGGECLLLPHALAIDPSDPHTLYIGLFGGVFRTTNEGDRWTEFNEGLTLPIVFDLAIAAGGHSLYAATYGGLFDYHFSNDP
jgi:photosystem II stability/assembly factor-like uncharacterized protein